MSSEVTIAGVAFAENDRRLYSELDLRVLARTLIQQRCQKQELRDDCEQQLLHYEIDQEQLWSYDNSDGCLQVTLHLFDAEYVRLRYEILLRWLQLARSHQSELCRQGFSQSSAHMSVGSSLVWFHERELALRPQADALGILTAQYRRIYL